MAALDGVFGRSHQLLLNKFFDPSTPSMRKVDKGKKKEEKNKYQPNGAGGTHLPSTTPQNLQHLTAHSIQNG